MILADTSIWIDHLRNRNEYLVSLLNNEQVMTHPFVIGELACGNLKNRAHVLSRLHDLPMIPVATDTEVLFFIEQQQLMGQGIGYIDAHLLTATVLASPIRLWTRDKSLQAAAVFFEFAYKVH